MVTEITSKIAKVCMAIEREIAVQMDHEEQSHLPTDRNKWDSKKLDRELNIYKAGLNREIPQEWAHIIKEHDPDYKEYLRLKKKFEGE